MHCNYIVFTDGQRWSQERFRGLLKKAAPEDLEPLFTTSTELRCQSRLFFAFIVATQFVDEGDEGEE